MEYVHNAENEREEMNLKFILQHLDKDGSDGCFQVRDGDFILGYCNVYTADREANSVLTQLRAEREQLAEVEQ